VSHEVVAAHVVGALSEVVAVLKISVDADALCSDSAHADKTDSACFLRVDRIEVIENRAVRCRRVILVVRARRSPCDFPVKAKIAPNNEVGREAWVDASAQGLWLMVEVIQIEVGSRWRIHAANPELGIDLLLSMKRSDERN